MNFKLMLEMFIVTMVTMFVANQAAGFNPTLRRVLKGSVVSPVGNNANSSTSIVI